MGDQKMYWVLLLLYDQQKYMHDGRAHSVADSPETSGVNIYQPYVRPIPRGKFGQGKNAYGLGIIQTRRKDTSESWIGAVFFVMNLVSLANIADLRAIFCVLFKKVSGYWKYPDGMEGFSIEVLEPTGKVCRNNRGIATA